MLSFVEKYSDNVTSQFGENGIIDECIKRIQPELKIAVEFGAPNRMYCSNIYPLIGKGWDCYYFDDKADDPYVTKKLITVDNINGLPKCSVLSMDTDGADYYLWKAYSGQPDIVVIEINSSLPPMEDHVSMEKGASYITMLTLGMKKGYFLLCHTGNMIFVLNKHLKLFPEVIVNGWWNWSDYFNKSWL